MQEKFFLLLLLLSIPSFTSNKINLDKALRRGRNLGSSEESSEEWLSIYKGDSINKQKTKGDLNDEGQENTDKADQ